MTNLAASLDSSATWNEIHGQPGIWRSWGANLNTTSLRNWIASQDVQEIWFSGAGTSAYVGDILAAALATDGPFRFCSVPSTEIVARPHALLRGIRRLVVSFGRSGNSPESVGSMNALSALAPHWPRLNITCNGNSALAACSGARAVILPEATHDEGFAMTASFSTMLLTALAIFDIALSAENVAFDFINLANALDSHLPIFRAEAHGMRRPARVVFVGSGPLAFAARESALKVMELSAGQIPALWDSTLGFRHGPKSFVTDGTDIWVFRSNDPHAAQYDNDLVAELRSQFPSSTITLSAFDTSLSDGWTAPLHVARAQVLAVVWSNALGLHVDDPFAGKGTLSRVVSGVRIHEVQPG